MENEENVESTAGEQKKGGNKTLYIVIIVLLLLINGVVAYFLFTDNQARKSAEGQNVTLEQQKKAVTDTLDAKKAELETLKGVDAGKDSAITVQQNEIEKKEQEIKSAYASGRLTAGELKKAKEMIVQYEASIADMKKQIDQLTAEKAQLTNQNQKLSTDLTSEKQTTAQLSDQNKGLSKKVELGSLLQLKNIMVEGISKKKNGKESVEKKIKHVESLRVTFETGENKLLEPGNLTLYMRVINPKGETVSQADQGSGTIKLAGTDETIQYTKGIDFDWAQANKKLIVYWSEAIKAPGTYKVEIYQSGYAIGLGQVEFK
jgi:hypothetical protein